LIRKSGIQIIGDIQWGTIICQFYKTRQDLLNNFIHYLKAGLDNNEFCVCISSKGFSKKKIIDLLKLYIPKFNVYLKREQIEFIAGNKWCQKGKKFNEQLVIASVKEKLTYAKKNGFDGVRIACDSAWMSEDDGKKLFEYEEKFSNLFRSYQIIFLYMFSAEDSQIFKTLNLQNYKQCAYICRHGKWRIIKNSEHSQLEEVFRKEESLQQEYKMLNRIIEMSPAAIAVLDAQGKVIFVNAKFERLAGFSKEKIYYKMYYEFEITDLDGIPFPDDKLPFKSIIRTGKPVNDMRMAVRRPDGPWVYITINASPLYNDSHQIEYVIFTVEDITDGVIAQRKIARLNRVYSVLNKVNEAVLRVRTPQELFDHVCRIAIEEGEFRMAWIGRVDRKIGRVNPVAYHRVEDGTLESRKIATIADMPEGQAPAEIAIREDKRFICHDIEHDERMKPLRGKGPKHSYQSLASIPLRVEGEAIGALTLYADGPQFFSDEEVNLLDELATDISFALEAMQREEIRKRIEEELKFKSLLLDNATDSIFALNPDGKIIYANKATYAMRGYTEDEFMKLNVRDFVAPSQLPIIKSRLEKTKKEEMTFESEHVKTDGNVFPVEIHTSSLQIGKQIILYGVARDITERKVAESNLRSALEKAKELEDIINRSPLVVMLGRQEPLYAIDYVSENVEQLFGYTQEDFLSGKVMYQNIVHPDDYKRAKAEAAQNVKNKKFEYYHEYRILNKKGELRWIGDVTWADLDSYGNIEHWHCLLTDITARKQIEEGKEILHFQLMQAHKMEAIGTFAGGAAHDFNNLLTAIIGYCELAMADLSVENLLFSQLKVIHESAMRAAGITHKLLAFSRQEPIKLEPVDINAIIQDLFPLITHLVGEDIKINTTLEQGIQKVLGDKGNIEQGLLNLALNAKDAMPDGGTITITTSTVEMNEELCRSLPEAHPGTFACISVSDAGMGMTEDIIQHIFEPFFTTKSVGKGTGLGLSVLYGVVKQHEGWINVSSEPGKGTTFALYLPIFLQESAPEEKEIISYKELQGNGEIILLVEDEQIVRILTNNILVDNGYVVFNAKDLSEALQIFNNKKGHFHLVLSDVVLPDGNGIQLTEILLRMKPQLKALLTSGYSDNKSQRGLIRKKKFPFLQKPYSIPVLLRAVMTALKT